MNRRLLAFSFLILFGIAVLGFHLTLFSGQVIKQFETFSIAESMHRVGYSPFSTTIPCDGGIRWVLELPLFASLAGVAVAFFPGFPALFPLLVFALFLTALFNLREKLDPRGNFVTWIALACAPVFLRFSTQFLADPFALCLVLFGVNAFLNRRGTVSFLFFLFAVSTKPTVLPSILFFRWAFAPERSAREWLPKPLGRWIFREIGLALAFVAPFLLWSAFLKIGKIPSPLHEGGLLNLGSDWAILFEMKFYSKFLNWTIFKGVGIPLFLIALFSAVAAVKKKSEWISSYSEDTILRLAAWSLGIFPYWFLIRRLNFIHDYYSLSFFLPIALLACVGAGALLRTLPPRKSRWVAGFLFLSIAQGIGLFAQSALKTPHLPISERPIFCGHEFRSEALMPGAAPAEGPVGN